MKHFWRVFVYGSVILHLAACVSFTKSDQVKVQSLEPVAQSLDGDLSGLWEYREGEIVYELLLDRHGKGTYEWQEGRFETTSLSEGQWKGKWMQSGNDREGGFEAQLAKDGLSAHGRWWYTRIEKDDDPLEPGGQFTLRRKGEEKQRNIVEAVDP